MPELVVMSKEDTLLASKFFEGPLKIEERSRLAVHLHNLYWERLAVAHAGLCLMLSLKLLSGLRALALYLVRRIHSSGDYGKVHSTIKVRVDGAHGMHNVVDRKFAILHNTEPDKAREELLRLQHACWALPVLCLEEVGYLAPGGSQTTLQAEEDAGAQLLCAVHFLSVTIQPVMILMWTFLW